MNNKNLIIGGVVVAGIVAYYLYNKRNKGGVASSSPSSIVPTMGGNLTDCKNIVTMPCLVAPCPRICADNVELPKKGGSPAVARDLTEQEKQKFNDIFNKKPLYR